jgi:hypothetical protein
MKKILKKIKKYNNVLYIYNTLLRRDFIQNSSLKYLSIGIKYPIFLYKVILFNFTGIVSRLHKKCLNSSITISSRLSNSKINLNFPFNYKLIKFN